MCTTLAWTLFVLLLITKRTFHPSRTTTSPGWIPGRGITTAIAGRTPLGGLGSRPWLQKVAVFLVACGLTVASVDAFREAAVQHGEDITDAIRMRDDVSGSVEVRVIRVISGVFIWLAQVQTLIRLFPRRKEKLIIKWFGFTLILCDLVFSSLNSFYNHDQYFRGSPRYYQDAIPALSYLFQLAISLLYLAWVSYYVITKRRYAFFISDQLNMTIIALFAMVFIAIPVGFFVADISVPAVAGWGDFFRWVGAAAASVVVWEWVERIEATEREEKRDGILGREMFEEDELPTSEHRSGGGSSESGSDGSNLKKRFSSASSGRGVLTRFSRRKAERGSPTGADYGEKGPNALQWVRQIRGDGRKQGETITGTEQTLGVPGRPQTPPSRTNTTSVGSTVYAVHYHPITITPPLPESFAGAVRETGNVEGVSEPRQTSQAPAIEVHQVGNEPAKPMLARLAPTSVPGWSFAAQAFKRRKRSPPVEVKQALSLNAVAAPAEDQSHQTRFDIRNRIANLRPGNVASSNSSHVERQAQQPTVIPAPPRGHTWSPEISRHSPVNRLQIMGTNTTLQVHPAVQQYLPRATPTAARQVKHDRQSPLETQREIEAEDTEQNVLNDSLQQPKGGDVPPHGTGSPDADIAPPDDGRTRDG